MKLQQLKEARYRGTNTLDHWIRGVMTNTTMNPGDTEYGEFDEDDNPYGELVRLFGQPDEQVGAEAWTWEINDQYGILYIHDEDDGTSTVDIERH